MNKTNFMDALDKALSSIPRSERQDILYDYEEHFRIGIEKGKTEDEISSALGDPRAIAKQFKADYLLNRAKDTSSTKNIFRAIFAVMGLGFVNLVFVLGPFLGLVGVIIGLFAASVAMTLSGVLLFIAGFVFPDLMAIFSIPSALAINQSAIFFVALGVTALGVLFTIGNCYLAGGLYKGTIKYLQFNINLIKRQGA